MIDGCTKTAGIIGDPVSHSFSPVMQNAAFRAKGLNYVYLAFCVAKGNLSEATRAIAALNLAGFNVTSPHKENIISCIHELSPEAELLGAVNTVAFRDGRLKGFNTDMAGFLYLLQNMSLLSVKGENVCLLGAGGAARAVSLALAKSGIEHLAIFNRTVEKGEAIRELLHKNGLLDLKKTSQWPLDKKTFPEAMQNSAFMINTLSIDPIEKGLLPENEKFSYLKAAVDLRYNPPEIPFLQWASAKNGCTAINGLDMLLGQGVESFKILTGQKAPLQVMKDALAKNLAGQQGESE